MTSNGGSSGTGYPGHPGGRPPGGRSSRLRRRAGEGAEAAFAPVLWLLGLMWAVEVADAVLPASLDAYGIHPRDTEGLLGIAASPFLHAGFGHLLANSVPFLILGALVAAEGLRRFWTATAVIAGAGGLGTWLIGVPGTVVVGASGIVFGYLTYVIARAFFARRVVDVLVAAVVIAIYGTLLVGVFPGAPGVSWQAHLMGAIAGVLAARVLHVRRQAFSR